MLSDKGSMPREIKLESRLELFPDEGSLPPEFATLIEAARQAAGNAYAPYSEFRVGAALDDGNGQITVGNNQENAAYPSGLCAERVALFSYFASNKEGRLQSLAIVAFRNGEPVPAHPCGSCRQTILEYEKHQEHPIKIIMAHDEGSFLVADSIKDLLPLGFTKQDLHHGFRG